ncbi:hypothetical protein Q3G72_006002 [Acer saccharum]|nr:hypothetical protein Q3G72_006002 [Acer saccharum]
MATVARMIHCKLGQQRPVGRRRELVGSAGQAPRMRVGEASSSTSTEENGKTVLQPRLCTLRSYGSDKAAVIKTRRDGGGDDVSLPFFETLSEYIESSKESHEFEIISGRLAMMVFAATVGMEVVTGNSVESSLSAATLSLIHSSITLSMACSTKVISVIGLMNFEGTDGLSAHV